MEIGLRCILAWPLALGRLPSPGTAGERTLDKIGCLEGVLLARRSLIAIETPKMGFEI